MKILSFFLGFVLLFMYGCGSNSNTNQNSGPFVYSKSDLNKISTRHPGHPIPQLLENFLTDPNFIYDGATHFDLGIENDLGLVLYLEPVNRSQDKDFLQKMEKEYPSEMAAMRTDPALAHPSYPRPFSLTDATRFANNNIMAFLSSSKGRPQRVEVLRKTLFYILTQ